MNIAFNSEIGQIELPCVSRERDAQRNSSLNVILTTNTIKRINGSQLTKMKKKKKKKEIFFTSPRHKIYRVAAVRLKSSIIL